MKNTIFVIILSIAFGIVADAQVLRTSASAFGDHFSDQSMIYQRKSDTTGGTFNSTTDTTGWFVIEPYRELALMLAATDSTTYDISVDVRNSFLINTNVGSALYADSLKLADSVAGGANTGERRLVLLKTTTLNRLNQPGYNQMRLRVAYRASLNGTTAARYSRVFLIKTN